MNIKLLNNRLGDLLQQRNLLLVFTCFLLVTNLVQVLLSVFSQERIVIVPPDVKQEYWVEGNRVSASYLEEMALYYSSLLLDNSPSTASFKREIILRNTISRSYGALKRRLLEDEERIKKDNVATSFQPNAVKVNPSNLSVELTGDLSRYVGEKRISQSRDTYTFGFVFQNGRLLIDNFKLIRSDTSGS